MGYDVFITNAPEDEAIAAAAFSSLEKAGIKCWLASKNLVHGKINENYILKTIKSAKIMVVIFSANTNKAANLAGQLNIATRSNLHIFPLRTGEAEPEGVMHYYLADTHWFDITVPPTEDQLTSLVEIINAFLNKKNNKGTRFKQLKNISIILAGGIFIYGGAVIILSLLQLSKSIINLIRITFP